VKTLHKALVAAAGLSVTASLLPLGITTAGAAPAARATAIGWGACEPGSFEEAIGLECGTLSVPMDYSDDDGAPVTLAVTRLVHTSSEADYQGVILTNPGGPGGSGTWLPVISFGFPSEVASTYDWIGFDPRGVGASTPSLSCDASYAVPTRPQYVPTSRAIENAWLARAKGYAADCGTAGGELLEHLTTLDTVRDMESIRKALGQDQINYYGYSYGTYLGQVYATRYPDRVRRMVLDSNIDPRIVWEESNLQQDLAFEKVIKIWFGWLARYDSVYHLGTTARAVERQYYRQSRLLARNPAGGVIGPAELNDVLLSAGYGQWAWAGLGTIFAAWVNDGDATGLIDWYGSGEGDNGYAMYLAVQCTDAPWSRSWPQWRQENWAMHARAPFVTWGNAWYNAPCAFWPAAAQKRLRVGTSRAPAILLVDQTLDAATPYEGSLVTRRLFPNSRLIAVEGGTSHAMSPDGNACVDDQITAYLRDGSLTPRMRGGAADSVCAALPQPIPDELATPAASPARAASKAFQRLKLAAWRESGALRP
jgi:pimeloyl-ACP methyl ester carboxylesterase